MTSKVIPFFRRFEVVVGKHVVRMFYLTVHRFRARVQSPTCTTCGIFLLECIMAVQTPKTGILIENNLKSIHQKNLEFLAIETYKYPISELAWLLYFPEEIFHSWYKLDFGP